MSDEIEIKFLPGCFSDDLTQEEIDEIVSEITKMAQDGTLLENSIEIDIDELEAEEPEIYHKLMDIEEPTIN